MKLKYVLKRIFGLNYKSFFETINKVSKKTKRLKIVVFFDIIYCAFKYQAGYMDYALFEMYTMNKKERRTIVTRGINNSFIKFFNDPKFNEYFRNKIKFNQTFNEYLNRDWLELKDYDSFLKFINNKKEFIAKPIDGTCGKGIEKIKINDYEPKKLYDYLKSNNIGLLEEVIKQNKIMNEMHPNSINTLRVITIAYQDKVSILTVFFRIGNGKVVDNFNSGGMVVPVNRKTGIIEYPALDKSGNLYEKHPLTNTSIIGFKIPEFEEACKLAMSAALRIPEIRMIGWDIAISETGPVFVEGNEFPGHDIYQLPPHRTGNIGLLPEFEESLKDIGVTKKMLGI